MKVSVWITGAKSQMMPRMSGSATDPFSLVSYETQRYCDLASRKIDVSEKLICTKLLMVPQHQLCGYRSLGKGEKSNAMSMMHSHLT